MNHLALTTQVPAFPGRMESWRGHIVQQDPEYLQRRLNGVPNKDDHFIQDRTLRRDVNNALCELASRDIALTESGLMPLISEVEDINRYQFTDIRRELEVLRAEIKRIVEAQSLDESHTTERLNLLEKRIDSLEGPVSRLCQLEKECIAYMNQCLEQVQKLDLVIANAQARIQRLEDFKKN